MDAHRAIPKGLIPRDLNSVLRPNKTDNFVEGDDNDLPPPYAELPELSVLPSYLSACPLKPYRPFPSVIRAHHRLSQLNSLTLSGENKADRLYYVEVHRGYQSIQPLGCRVGVLLRNGPHSKDEVLAAAGEESQLALRIYGVPHAPESNSVFFLPPLEFGTNSRAMTMEKMRPDLTFEEAHAFTFFVEVEPIRKLKRQKFQWVQSMDDDGCGKSRRFKLVRVLRNYNPKSDDGCASSSNPPDSGVYGEIVGTLVFPQSSITNREVFTLTMLGSAMDGRLGERCEIAIVVTALRVWNLHAKGQLESSKD